MPASASSGRVPALQLSGIGKSFGTARVLDNVSLDLRPGEVHVLAGENGAGKSTLIKIIAGVYQDYDGTVRVDGHVVRFSSPLDARRQGVAVIHQELSLVDAMSVTDNLNLGREATRGFGWWLDRRAQVDRATALCRDLELDFSVGDLARPAGEFPLSVKNRLEIAKALSSEARILVMDEPTSALHRSEVDRLFRLVGGLKERGVGVIYISHKMEEIYRIADRITVLRDGVRVKTAERAECPPTALVRAMIGRELGEHIPSRAVPPASAPVVLSVRELHIPHADPKRADSVRGVSFHLHAGEIVGLAGLQGSGTAELLHGLFGARGPVTRGQVEMGGRAFLPSSPADSTARGLALVTADRKSTGLVLGLSIEHNVTLAALRRLSPGGLLRASGERRIADNLCRALGVRCTSVEQEAGELSGGNQQKLALAKWLETQPRVLLMEEPTRGVDVGAKHEIYELMNQWTREGRALLVMSTDMPELLRMSDRILVMHRGAIAAEFARAEATPENVLAAAMGAVATPPAQ